LRVILVDRTGMLPQPIADVVMASIFAIDGFFERQSLVYRGFLEKRDAQDLQDFVQRKFHIQFLANVGSRLGTEKIAR
jgi:hypothetical protein